MEQKIKAYICEWQMIKREDMVIVGISGGADSVCLLYILKKLSGEWGFCMRAVHIHHGIRGAEADNDEAYVRELCERLAVPLSVYHENVPAYAREQKMTEEEAGRKMRRMRLREVKEAYGGTKIALAHHANDNVETVLFHLCRGTGLRGLRGIAPMQDAWIRPLLCVKRREIERYLEEEGISYCTDATNQDYQYTRNRIRGEIIPCLETYINKETVEHFSNTIAQMYRLNTYVDRETGRYEKQCVREEDGKVILNREAYQKVPKELREYLLGRYLCRAAGRQKDLEAVHTRLLEELLEKQTGKTLDLPYGVKACRTYEGIELQKGAAEISRDKTEQEAPVRMRILKNNEEGQETFPRTPYTKWFDYDIIRNTVKIRHRQPGDYITVNREGGTQKLKQYFINEKIPQKQRDSIWLVADGHHILWIVGYRQNQSYQVTDKTKRILEIEFYGGEKDGGND